MKHLLDDRNDLIRAHQPLIHKSVIVICRECGDDEDSVFVYSDITESDAIEKAKAEVMNGEETASNPFFLNTTLTSNGEITSHLYN